MRKLKGLILAGGKGTRLRPITHTSAKQLVPVANEPVLFYGIRAIREAGIEEIGIVVGDTAAEIKEAVGDGSAFGVKVEYIHQSAPLGLAHAVLESRDYLGDTAFVMYLGDNLILRGIHELVNEFRSGDADAQIMLAAVPNPSSFGVAYLDETGRVTKLEEKPPEPMSNLALVGVYMFDQPIWEAVRSIKPSQRGELEITDAIQWLVDAGKKVQSHMVTGWWKDTGKLEDMLEANRMVLDTFETKIEGEVQGSNVEFKVVIQPGARIIDSTVRGPAIIGANTVIENSYVGPFTSIYHDCHIRNCEIEHSIVLESSRLHDLRDRICDSLIGRDVTVAPSELKPRAIRLMLGDSSDVRLF
ncbi:MAG: glucose-1-phosphate thymidylyltransferase [Candidatus Lernaella stagnicola]|nr:glucose-1-phosphate thymidylyltransferase [Candidatus Lernaella stagnicola]